MNESKISVLAVEDDEDILNAYSILLPISGYRFIGASDVVEAIKILNDPDQTLDIILTDERLPDGNGLEVALESKRLSENRPIIVCSGTVSDDSELAGLAFAVLQKPFTPQKLKQTVGSAVQKLKLDVSSPPLTLGDLYRFQREATSALTVTGDSIEVAFFTKFCGLIREVNDALISELNVAPERILSLPDNTVIPERSAGLLRTAQSTLEHFIKGGS